VDGQDKPSPVLEAYSTEIPTHREFLLNGLEHANAAFGTDIFLPTEWTYEATFDPAKHQLEFFYMPIRDVTCDIGSGPPLTFRKGTKIGVIFSRKWPYPYMQTWIEEIGLKVSQAWRAKDRNYYKSPSPSGR
jgi:uncharacterized SAM-dependent methyltransferase